jgi:chemotaxis signal transduction protein
MVCESAAADSPVTATGAAVGSGGAARGAYLTYRAGGEFATALDQIAEIVPMPESFPTTGGRDGMLGVTAHRATALPLICLATRLGRQPDPGNRCVPVVDVDGTNTGFVVDNLGSIDTGEWSDAAGAAAMRDPQRRRLVRLRDSQRTVTELDLRGFGRSDS